MTTKERIVLPDLPDGYEWDTSDGDYNIINSTVREIGTNKGLICYIRPETIATSGKNVIRAYTTDHDEDYYDNLQDAINVMTTNFTLGIYFEDETS